MTAQCLTNEKIFIPTNVPSSKNGKRWTGKFLISSKVTMKWRKETEPYWMLYKQQFLRMIKDKPKPYRVTFKFIRGSKHQFDFVNPLQTVQDEMVKYGWIEDDNADELLPVLVPYEYDKSHPGVFLTVL